MAINGAPGNTQGNLTSMLHDKMICKDNGNFPQLLQ